MASSDGRRRGLLTAGGVLSILGGAFELIVGVWFFLGPLALGLNVCGEHFGDLAHPPPPPPMWHLIIGGFVLVALGLFAIIGGVSAIRRRSFGVSLAGAICTLPLVIFGGYLTMAAVEEVIYFRSLPSPAMAIPGLASLASGILAIVFVALGRREFAAKGTSGI